jgi:cell division protein DivIC
MSKRSRARAKSRKRGAGSFGFKAIIVIVVLIGVIITSRWAWAALEKGRVAEERLNSLIAEKARLEEVQRELKEEIERLNTPSYIEQLAREQSGLVHKGEILVAPREENSD